MRCRIIFRALLILLLVCCQAACQREAPIQANGRSIAVGLIVNGPQHEEPGEDPTVMGARWLFEHLAYLADGTAVEVLVHYDEGSAEGVRAAYSVLAGRKDLAAIITFSESDLLLATVTEGDALEVPIIAAVASNPDVATGSRMISQLSFDDRFQGAVAALFIRDELLIERVAVISDSDSRYSDYLAREFSRKFQSVGGMLIASIDFAGAQKDHGFDWLQALRDRDAELLYIAIDAEDALGIARELARMDWHPRVMVSDGVLANWIENSAELLPLVQGVLATDLFSPGMYLPPRGRRLIRRFEAAGGELTTYSIMGIDAANLLWLAMSDCASAADSSCVHRRIRDFDEFDGLMGRIGFTDHGHAIRPLIINRIKGSQRRFVARVY